MSLLLSIETSTSICSVALHEEGYLIQSIENEIPQSASSQLAVMIHQALESAKKKSNQIQAVVVSAGPGSYTGLRIGVATAKGICYALQVPLISINTLELLAYQYSSMVEPSPSPPERGLGGEVGEVFCPMLDARRMEVYCMLLDSNLSILEPTHAKIIDESSFKEQLDQRPIYFFGNGADKCKEAIRHSNAHFISGIVPSAARLGELAFKKYKAALFEDVATFEPFYLKDFLIRKPNPV
ncbi:MAG: tRNA (adenosine(37)-N6)-threonylcarbamoyltransferase complex dimerization subunit type 1 TsaB [Cyclobacteriaceae bacterium]